MKGKRKVKGEGKVRGKSRGGGEGKGERAGGRKGGEYSHQINPHHPRDIYVYLSIFIRVLQKTKLINKTFGDREAAVKRNFLAIGQHLRSNGLNHIFPISV